MSEQSHTPRATPLTRFCDGTLRLENAPPFFPRMIGDGAGIRALHVRMECPAFPSALPAGERGLLGALPLRGPSPLPRNTPYCRAPLFIVNARELSSLLHSIRGRGVSRFVHGAAGLRLFRASGGTDPQDRMMP